MKDSTKSNISIIVGITIFCVAIAIIGYYTISGVKSEIKSVDEQFGGQSSGETEIVGTYGSPTASTTAPVTFGNDNDLSVVATSSDVVELLPSTDSVLFTIFQPNSSSTNFFSWHIMGSNDWECYNAIGTSTTDDTYDATLPLIGDINWYSLELDESYDNYATDDIVGTEYHNASTTSFVFQDINWNCLRIEYRGASTTALMQMKQKVNN